MATLSTAADTGSPRAAKPSSAASAGKRAKKGKQDKSRSASASGPSSSASKEEERAANDAATVDHPYLSFLHKRIRSSRKKLEKIKGLEHAQATDGKVLNPQQAELVGNKALLEKMITEFKTLRGQFIDVYLEEEAAKKAEEEKQAVATSEAIAEATAAATAAVAAAATTEEIGVNTEAEEDPADVEEKPEQPEDARPPMDEYAHVQELLKTLHVVNLHQALGKEVPMVLDFFSKVLLGNTRPPAEISYEENLAESLEEAKKYLTQSNKEFACDMSYVDLRAFVEKMVASSSTSTSMSEFESNAEATVIGPVIEKADSSSATPVTVDSLPQINFLTESQLEPEQVLPLRNEAVQAETSVLFTNVDALDTPALSEDQESAEAEEAEDESVVYEEQVEVEMAEIPSAPSAPPMPFAVVAAGTSSGPAPPPKAWSQEAEGSSNGSSPQEKSGNSRRRAQGGRGKEGNRNSSASGGLNASKPRRARPQRAADDNGSHRSGSKDSRHQREERGLRKQARSTEHSSLIAPQA